MGSYRRFHNLVSRVLSANSPTRCSPQERLSREWAPRRAVIDALVADRDPRVVPMLGRIVAESHPLGRDHDVVVETLTALGTVGSDEGIPILAKAVRQRAFFRRKKLRAIKEKGVGALVRIGTPRAATALEEAGRTGDRMLKKIVAGRRAS